MFLRRTSLFRAAVFVFLFVATGALDSLADDNTLEGLETYVSKAIQDWDVPGLALAIVKDDQVVFAKGFGVCKRGEPRTVDAETLFAIGSTSKGMTAACLAMLVDEGKLAWDDAVTKHLTEFELSDPYVTRELAVRDLLCHRSGLPRGDALWYATPYDRAEVLRRVRYLKPNSSFRSKFGYQNIMYLAAGQIIARASGTSWEKFVRQRLFEPLGMKLSCTSVSELAGNENVSTPHANIDDAPCPVAWRNIDNIAPAGSINSCASDMARWLRLQLGDGQVDGRRLVSAAAMKEMRSPHTIVPITEAIEELLPDVHFLAYGLGWQLLDYHGRKVADHGGGIDGMTAQVALMPEEKLGLVILCNRGGTLLPNLLKFHIFDRYLKITYQDLSAQGRTLAKKQEEKAREEKAKQEASRVVDTKASLALEKYTGTFNDELYGEAQVALEGDHLMLSRGPALVADLEHWHFDTFRAQFHDKVLDSQFVTFRLDASGKVGSLEISDLGTFLLQPPTEKAPQQTGSR